MKQLKNRCQAQVSDGTGFHSMQCENTGVVELDGRYFCKLHARKRGWIEPVPEGASVIERWVAERHQFVQEVKIVVAAFIMEKHKLRCIESETYRFEVGKRYSVESVAKMEDVFETELEARQAAQKILNRWLEKANDLAAKLEKQLDELGVDLFRLRHPDFLVGMDLGAGESYTRITFFPPDDIQEPKGES